MKFTKKTLSHILFYVFCQQFPRTHRNYLFHYDLCWMWHFWHYLEHVLKNILLFFQPVFWYVVLFDKKLIAIHHVDNSFLFYFDICIKFPLSLIILTMEKWYHLTWCLNYIIKQIFYKNILNILRTKQFRHSQTQ